MPNASTHDEQLQIGESNAADKSGSGIMQKVVIGVILAAAAAAALLAYQFLSCTTCYALI